MRVDNENSKKVKRDKKKLVAYHRYPSCRRSYLIKLLLDLLSIYELILPKYHTDNSVLEDYPDLPVVYEKEQEELLLIKLVHYNTLINYTHRPKRYSRTYISVEEDVLAALMLMKELVKLSQISVPKDQDAFVLHLIKEHVEPGVLFRTGELYRHLGISQKKLQESLCRLHDGGKVKRVSGNRYRGYNYELT